MRTRVCCNFLVNQKQGWFIENSEEVVPDDGIAHKIVVFQGFQLQMG